ncbi:N-alpha-acetyltransferase 25, NatB auxiliary subunit-like [Lingula anatina]|uniref:N-alpha-acetyltransferase 25, NatB auxiliary subunit-like n=1 Tax=Lingula anatina TaxID=7574 RepID=A0A1S3IEV0_LINAN|nr:N-alpha-acetyltransferase 25, NatB auxiliary subunit-like [Lingula anatina]|eukprot:XP_013396790.1 N-alpha-acetyltransferase 25, NatB auxiliary subunit-like [Lingula anatina]
MAGRVHVDVSERRLRPIYDCLDNGNNKEAIKEADKVLKKQKNFQCAKVLKALALLRTGKQDESCNILKAVHAEHPTDDSTLQAMVICYKEMHELDQIATLYENASKAQPDNEEILSALFMAYVRIGNYKKQQQTAMALHRLQPHKNPYYFWAVMSIVMQAHETENLAKTMFLPLAERMAQKYVKDDKIEAEAEVQLYLMILDLLDKPQEALKMVEGPLGAKLTMEQNLCQTKRGELCIQLKKWPQANMIFRQLLLDNPDNWYFYSQYLKSLFALIEQDWSPEPGSSEEGPIDNTVEKALNFISERIEETKENQKPQRGPYLARLELYKLLRQSNKPELDKLGSAFQLLEEYFDLYGSKPCCFMDLKPYMCLLEDDEKQKWCNFMLEKVCLVSGDQLPENQKHMQQHLNVCQLQRHIGEHHKTTHEEKLLLIQQLFKRYKHGLQFGQELLTTDLQHSDNYLLLAVHLLVDVWRETGQQQFLREAIVQLEEALQKSPSSFQFKMALIKLYCLLGAFGPCPAVYDSMDIKHIQNDTLGYLVSNSVSKLGFLNSACAMYGSMLRFFSVNHKDTTEYLIQAYRYGSFTKVQEFVKFRERLQQSLQYASATEERRLLDLTIDTDSHSSTEKMLGYMDVEPDKDTISWAKLRDNRDLEAMLSWDPEDRGVNDEVKKRSEEEEIQWLKIRNLTFRCLAASVMLSKSDSKYQCSCNQ